MFFSIFFSSRKVLVWMLGITLVLAVEAVFLYRQNVSLQNTNATPKTYAECIGAKDSIIRESYPATCVAFSGEEFIQPIPKSDILMQSTTNWNRFTNHDFLFTYRCPASSRHTVTTTKQKDGFLFPLSQESCSQNQDQVNISVWKISKDQSFTLLDLVTELSGASLVPIEYAVEATQNYQKVSYKEQNSSKQVERSVILYVLPYNYIRLEGFSEDYFGAIASTFAFVD